MGARFTLDDRRCGVLLHPTSLRGRHGSGDLGPAARRFVDFLAEAGQGWWQMLPVGPIGAGNSPYSSYSAFAGNPLLISLELLVEEGLLARSEVKPLAAFRAERVNYRAVIPFRLRLLRRAFDAFARDASARQRGALKRFRQRERRWLDDYALFGVLTRAHKNAAWNRWPRELASRDAAALRRARREQHRELAFECFTQFVFDRQWRALRAHCLRRGVGLIGDVPIFVSHDSADVWANQALYQLDARGRPRVVSGCPPDAFSKAGQLWGHPLYRWTRHERTGFAWWIARFQEMARRFDAMRIDHFLGFNRCWTIPGRARTARSGRWTPSPGRALFDAVRRRLGRLEIIAEDLGVVTPQAVALREHCGFPGLRIVQQGFGEGARYDQPHTWPRHCVAYTGTHDTDTAVGWFRSLPKSGRRHTGRDRLLVRERALRYLGGDGRDIHWEMIRALYASVAHMAIVPMQDVLGLDSRARMNIPATGTGNWEWRMKPTALTKTVARRLRSLAEAYERLPE